MPALSEVVTLPLQVMVSCWAPGSIEISAVWLLCWSSYTASHFAPFSSISQPATCCPWVDFGRSRRRWRPCDAGWLKL